MSERLSTERLAHWRYIVAEGVPSYMGLVELLAEVDALAAQMAALRESAQAIVDWNADPRLATSSEALLIELDDLIRRLRLSLAVTAPQGPA